MGALKLFDGGGQALLDRPFLKEIILALQGRPEAQRTGKAVLEHLNRPPHGWPERAVKAGLGALLRARRLTVRLADGAVIRSESDAKAEGWLTGTQAFNKGVLELSDLNISPAERELLTRLFAEVFGRPGLDTIEKLEKQAPPRIDEWLANTRESVADLRGRQLPGAEVAESLKIVLEAAAEPDLPAGKLKQLVAAAQRAGGVADAVATLKAQAALVDTVDRLRQQRHLDRLAAARVRAVDLYASWTACGGGAGAALDLATLQALVKGPELLQKPDAVLEHDRVCFEAYAGDFATKFRERQRTVAVALGRLEKHAGWRKADAAQRGEIQASLESLAPEGSADLSIEAHPDGRDPVSRASYADLVSQIELIDAREQRAVRALDALVAPAPPPKGQPPSPTERSLTMELSSAADLPALYEKIGDLARTALDRPRRVHVSFEDKDS